MIIELNKNLESNPELINESPYDEGWILKIKVNNSDEFNSLLSYSDYEKLIKWLIIFHRMKKMKKKFLIF